MTETDEGVPTLPMWRWILRALSPSLVYLLISPIGLLEQEWATAISLAGFFLMPAITLVALLVVSRLFYEDVPEPHAVGRFWFIVGFGVLNGFIIFAGCALPHQA
jgi:hypothetical protein